MQGLDCSQDEIKLGGQEGIGVSSGSDAYIAGARAQKVPQLGFWQSQGSRNYQEDRVSDFQALLRCGSNESKPSGEQAVECYAVYDGHGGTAAVDFVHDLMPKALQENLRKLGADCEDLKPIQEALCRSFEAVESALQAHLLMSDEAQPLVPGQSSLERTRSVVRQSGLSSGCCACVAILLDRMLCIANLGDCRALLCSPAGIHLITQDHRPDVHSGEAERLKNAGIEFSSDGYIHGQIGVSRAFGDIWWDQRVKCSGIVALPEIFGQDLVDSTEFLLLACDGIFEKLSSTEAVQIVRRNLRTTKDPQKAAQKLVTYAEKSGSEDNLSAVVVLFKVPQPTDPCTTAPKLIGP